MRQYWAHPINRSNKRVGPFETREAAVKAAFDANPRAKEVTSGYGTDGAWFDIRWIRRDQFERS